MQVIIRPPVLNNTPQSTNRGTSLDYVCDCVYVYGYGFVYVFVYEFNYVMYLILFLFLIQKNRVEHHDQNLELLWRRALLQKVFEFVDQMAGVRCKGCHKSSFLNSQSTAQIRE